MNDYDTSSAKKETWQSRFHKALWTFLTIAAAILFFYIMQYLGTISRFVRSVITGISPVIWGLIFAYLLDPVATFYERNLCDMFLPASKKPERTQKLLHIIAALLTLLTAIAFIGILLWLIVPEITNSISGIVKELPSQAESLNDQLQNRTFFDNNSALGKYANSAIVNALQSAEDWLMSYLPSQANQIFSYLFTGVKGVFNVVYNLVIGLILSVYITIDKERLQRQVKQMTYSLLPTATAVRIRRILGRGNKKFSSAIRGKIVDSMIIGLLCFTALMILNALPWFSFPYPVLLAVVVGVTNVVPFFGPFVGGFIGAVLVLFSNPHMVIPFVILIIILQQFDCNYLDPHIVGGSIGLRPFWSIFSCLLGSSLLGVPGFVIGPPVFAFIYEIVSEWSEDRLRAKHLDDEFDIPPEEDFEDFAEKEEAFTGSLLDTDESEDEEERLHLMQLGKEKLRQTIQKHRNKNDES